MCCTYTNSLPVCSVCSVFVFVFWSRQRFSFVTPASDGGDSSDDSDDDDDEEEEVVEGEFIDGVGMSEAEERLVASFMNAGAFGRSLRGAVPWLMLGVFSNVVCQKVTVPWVLLAVCMWGILCRIDVNIGMYGVVVECAD